MVGIELLEIGQVAEVNLLDTRIADIENGDGGIVGEVEALNIRSVNGETLELGATRGIKRAQALVGISIKGYHLGVVGEVERLVEILRLPDFKEHQLGLVAANLEGFAVEGIVAHGNGCKRREIGEVKLVQEVVVEVEIVEIGHLLHLEVGDVAAVKTDDCDIGSIAPDTYEAFFGHIAGDGCTTVPTAR